MCPFPITQINWPSWVGKTLTQMLIRYHSGWVPQGRARNGIDLLTSWSTSSTATWRWRWFIGFWLSAWGWPPSSFHEKPSRLNSVDANHPLEIGHLSLHPSGQASVVTFNSTIGACASWVRGVLLLCDLADVVTCNAMINTCSTWETAAWMGLGSSLGKDPQTFFGVPSSTMYLLVRTDPHPLYRTTGWYLYENMASESIQCCICGISTLHTTICKDLSLWFLCLIKILACHDLRHRASP